MHRHSVVLEITLHTATIHSATAKSAGHIAQSFPPLETETRPTVATDQAAYYLNRKPQTMRVWASTEAGAIRPIRVNGRLAWPVADIKRILGVK
ncbi:hypothetical protein [Aquabacterium sp.]|uniref:hypothetical protein n=1 Tax=Aquabacterium sp. TaxID=1872578 RepID=UPI00248728FB|nr:hypothetical protein [Aquabacterium sp.]MDI1260247.1 hypothetical protein [Aquabacterium sp.]